MKSGIFVWIGVVIIVLLMILDVMRCPILPQDEEEMGGRSSMGQGGENACQNEDDVPQSCDQCSDDCAK